MTFIFILKKKRIRFKIGKITLDVNLFKESRVYKNEDSCNLII